MWQNAMGKIFYEFYLVFRLKYNIFVLTNKNNFIFLSKDDFTKKF